MKKKLEFIFKYCNSSNITIDKDEFIYQFKSHSDYPSLLALSDTLSFFEIENYCLEIAFEEIDNLPDNFVAFLKHDRTAPNSYFIEKKGKNQYSIHLEKKGKIKVNKNELSKKWKNLVLLIQKPTEVKTKKVSKKVNILNIIYFVISILSIGFIYYNTTNSITLFYISYFINLFLLVSTSNILNSEGSLLYEKFCNISKIANCRDVKEAKKWKLLKHIDFEKISIIFFTSELIFILLLPLHKNFSLFYSLNKILYIPAIPIILASLYYQINIIKKICPICIVVIITFSFHFIHIFLYPEFQLKISDLFIHDSISIAISFILALVFWKTTLYLINKNTNYKNELIQNNRLIRNYRNFKTILMSSKKYNLPCESILLGNKSSQLKITIFTTPFCKYCEELNYLAQEILRKYQDKIRLEIILRADTKNENSESLEFIKKIICEGENYFNITKDWYNKKDLHTYSFKNIEKEDLINAEINLNKIKDWCNQNELTFTPILFINGYQYPKSYDKNLIKYFISDLIEDTI